MVASQPIERQIDAHLSGHTVQVPPEQQAEFERALAAHRALRIFLDETAVAEEGWPDAEVPPDVSQHYDIERELGRGGMGVVYLARQKSLDRRVALKVLRPAHEALHGHVLQRFRDEAQHLAKLRHPHIVSIHEVGEAASGPYFTMDYIEGEPLSSVIARGALPPSQAVAVLKQVAAAVQHAHRHGIIHRDLKPGNVLLDQSGHAFVTDFGLARNVTQDSSLTQSGELLGTPLYMAPEQARGEPAAVGEATDIHALGILLFEMLTGRPPYTASTPIEVLVKLVNDAPPSLRSIDRRIPKDLETICLKMLQKSPAARYANVSAVLEDLRRFEAGEPLLARRPNPLVRAARWALRHIKLVATAVITAAVVAAVVPPLLDKSVNELVAWGDEELASGRPEIAGEVYTRALHKAQGKQRDEIALRIVQTCRQMEDGKAALDLALPIVSLVPDVSFGRHDFLFAQALVNRQRAQSPANSPNIWQEKPSEELMLVRSRLELALQAPLNDSQKLEIEEELAAVNLALAAGQPWVRTTPQYLYALPTGSDAELQATLADEKEPVWNRGRAAMALAQSFERQKRQPESIEHYQSAYELMRSVYPMYAGVKAAQGAGVSRLDAPDAEECLLVRRLVDRLRQLTPESLPEPKGRLEFEVVGFQLPRTIGMELGIMLCDPSIDTPDRGLPHQLPRLVPVRQDALVSVGVLDGEYRLRMTGNHSRWSPSVDRLSRLLQVEAEGWPKQVKIQGAVVRLPPVRLWVAEEIELTSPADAATVDLNKVVFTWRPVTTAANYRVQLLHTSTSPNPTTSFFLTVATDGPRLELDDLTEGEKSLVCDNWTPGRTAGFRVDAYDVKGRRIGECLYERHFFVANALETP